MFSKNDFANMFKQISELENKMKNDFIKLYNNVESEEYKKIFKKLAKEEVSHNNIVEKIIKKFLGLQIL